jgi:CubicO group peptidase (beta-lactamase class C family)
MRLKCGTKWHLMIAALANLSLSAVVALHADTLPGIIDPPLTQFAWLERSVTFKVSYSNQTVMNFQWQWNGANVSDATNKTLRLTSVQPTNGGDYRVILSNSAGVVTSAVARLTVRDWPQPTEVSLTNLASLESNLKSVLRQHDVPGASLAIMKDGRLILARGYGYADPEHSDEAVQPDSIFAIASLSKAITATAVLKLVDEGRLNLDDPVFPMLNLPTPTFPGAQPDPRLTNITVRQCLNHTAGWNRDTARNPNGGIGFNPNAWLKRCAADLGITGIPTPRELVGWITGFPLQSKPGTSFYYSNVGYIVAGVLIEQITGRPYDEAIRSLLGRSDITRLRIPGTTLADRKPDEVVRWLSPIFVDFVALNPGGVTYEPVPSITSELAYSYPFTVWPGAGGWAMSAIDYARFITAIDGMPIPSDLISSNAVKTMLTVTPQSVSYGTPYGMGWYIDPSTGEISHAGTLETGVRSLAVRRKDGVVYVMFCNTYDTTLNDDLKGVLDSAVSAKKSWPTNDLFTATMSYEAWQARHFTPAELSQPEISGDEADPDGDGISNLVEYAQGSDPRVADHEPWLKGRLVGDGNQLRFAVEYRRRPLGHAVAYDMEVSSDLKTWQPFDAAANEQLGPDGMLTVNIQDAATDANLGTRFYRVNVRRSP